MQLQNNAFRTLPDVRQLMQDTGHMMLHVYLKGNSLHCTVDMCWMLEYTSRLGYTFNTLPYNFMSVES